MLLTLYDISLSVYSKKCAPKFIFINEFLFDKIRIIFDGEN